MNPEEMVLHQERVGQTQLVNSAQLPASITDEEKEYLQACGVVFGEKNSEIFVEVIFPDGWAVVPSFEPRLSALVDERNRERARIVYKHTFYNHYSWFGLTCRYNVRDWDPAEILEDRGLCEFVREVADGGSALQATGEAIFLCSAEIPAEGHGLICLQRKLVGAHTVMP